MPSNQLDDVVETDGEGRERGKRRNAILMIVLRLYSFSCPTLSAPFHATHDPPKKHPQLRGGKTGMLECNSRVPNTKINSEELFYQHKLLHTSDASQAQRCGLRVGHDTRRLSLRAAIYTWSIYMNNYMNN